MTRRSLGKKDLERRLLESFISNESLGLRVKSIEDSETPDFIIDEMTRIISIELTRLIHPKLIQIEAFHEKIVEAARLIFRERHNTNLRVLVNFCNTPIKCKASEFDSYVEQLCSLVETAYVNNKDFDFRLSSRRRPVNHFIDSISISNDLYFENWQPFGAYRVDDVDTNWLKQRIKSKEDCISKYQRAFDEKWLLLVANFGHKSSTHGFDSLGASTFESSFDRIYLYTYMNNAITLLNSNAN